MMPTSKISRSNSSKPSSWHATRTAESWSGWVRLAQRPGIRLAIRIGIHTGLVVVGDMGGGNRQEQLALGEAPNVAARLQGFATPDTVAISSTTFQLVQGYFTYQDLGAHALKGLT